MSDDVNARFGRIPFAPAAVANYNLCHELRYYFVDRRLFRLAGGGG